MPQNAPLSLLLVDDDRALREVTGRSLAAQGYRVETAVDGEDALAKAIAAPPDLVVSDVMMPKMDGVTLVRRLRAEEATRNAYCILLTAKDRVNDVLEGFEATADDYVTKPFRVAELAARVAAGARLKRMQDELRESNRQLREALAHRAELLGAAAHEIRNPVNVITTYLPLLGKGIVPDATIGSVCLRRSRELVLLIDNLHDYAKIEAGLVRLQPEPTCVGLLAREARELFVPVAHLRGVSLSLEGPEKLHCLLDRARMIEVLDTLLGNAVALCPDGGRVSLAFGLFTDRLRFDCRTDGGGLAAGRAADLFEAPRADVAPPPGYDMGMLLGFAIVRKLAELMGGSVVAESDGEGKGLRLLFDAASGAAPAV